MRRVVGFTFLSLALLTKLLFSSGNSAGSASHDAEIDAVRSTPIERIARTGLNDSDTLPGSRGNSTSAASTSPGRRTRSRAAATPARCASPPA